MIDLKTICTVIDGINRKTGLTVAWLALAMVLVQFSVVLSRYVFAVGSIPAQETIWYMHGTLFMMGAGYTLLRDGHVRVDVFYREGDAKKRAKIDLFGTIFFLLPVCLFILSTSWSYIVNSWVVFEGSTETNGIPAIFALKTVVPVATFLLMIQGISMGLRCIITLQGGGEREGEVPDEAGELLATPRGDRNRVLTLAIFLVPIELFSFIVNYSYADPAFTYGRIAILVGLLLAAYAGRPWARTALVIGLFAAGGMSIYVASDASGDPGAMITLLAYGNVVGAIILTLVPWSGDTSAGSAPVGSPSRSPGFAIVAAIVVYVLASEVFWLIETMVTVSGGIAIKDLPRWMVPSIFRLMLVAALLSSFFRGSIFARWGLTALLGAGFVYSVLQVFYSPADGIISMVGTGGIIVGILHLGVAVFLARSESVGSFLDDQRRARRALLPSEAD